MYKYCGYFQTECEEEAEQCMVDEADVCHLLKLTVDMCTEKGLTVVNFTRPGTAGSVLHTNHTDGTGHFPTLIKEILYKVITEN